MRDTRSPGRPSDTIHGTIVAVDTEGRKLAWTNGQWIGHPALVNQAQCLVAAKAWLVAFGADGLTVDTALFRPGGHDSFTVAADAVDPTAAVAVMSVVCGPGVMLTGDIPDKAIVDLEWLVDPAGEPDVIHEDLAGIGAIGLLVIAGVIGHGMATQAPTYPPGTSRTSITGQSSSLNPFKQLADQTVGNIGAVLDNPDAYAAAHPNG